MKVLTTCRSCKGPLQVTDDSGGDNWHPTCPESPTPVERMTTQYLAAIENGDARLEAELSEKLWEIQKPPPRLHAAARMYATTYGWPVFPLRPFGGPCDADLYENGGKECRDAGICFCPKKPATRHGFQDATTDLAQIDQWWGSKNYNIGIPTGVYFDVIDVDPPRGWESWQSIRDKTELPDVHGRVVTQSMGAHFYVTPTGGGNRARIYPGIDYRGVGGYVVAPPSWLGDQQHSWSWGVYPSPFIVPTLAHILANWQQVQGVSPPT